MQLSTYLLAALAATATATAAFLPTSPEPSLYTPPTATEAPIYNQTLPTLSKRGHYGWVASFAGGDIHCKGGFGGPRPKIHSKCVEFHPLSTRVKIDWGTWPLGFDQLNVYTDGHCRALLRTVHKGKSGDSCVDTRGFWGSVMFNDVKLGG